MKRRTRKALLLVVGAALLAALPVVGTLVYAHVATLERSRETVEGVARTVAHSTEGVLLTVEAALADVAYDARLGCGPELIREMRNKTVALPTLQGMGYVDPDGFLRCTSYGMVQPPVPADGRTLVQPSGSLIWFTPPQRTDFLPGTVISAVLPLRDGAKLFASFSPDQLVNGVEPDVLGRDGHVRVSLHGLELVHLGVPETRAPDFLASTVDVGLFDTRVTGLASREWALAPWRENVLVTGGIGLAAGLVLAGAAASLGRKRLSLAAELRDGLDNEEFEIWYQPVIDLQAGRCAGAEALIRWRHPEQDLIPPDLFIALAEESGAIVPMTRWLMGEVARAMGPLLRDNPALHIGINLAPTHVTSHEIVEDARHIFADHHIRPSQILFELTERGLMDHPACREVVDALAALGSEVAIDDFGTGYSSLAYIEKFRLDYLKIDKVFVAAVGRDAPAARLTDVIIDMAQSLNLKTIAEGVETEAQALYLRDRGVHYAQGWFFSKPLDEAAFLAFVRCNGGGLGENLKVALA